MKKSFLEFCNELKGYSFHSKRTGYQVYKFEMYWHGLTPKQCFERYNTKVVVLEISY
jgi:hypothetical protein